MEVELADRRRERIWVVDRERPGVAVVDLEAVAKRQLRPFRKSREHPSGVDLLELNGGALLNVRGDCTRRGTQRPDLDSAIDWVSAEDPVRIGVLPADQRVELGVGDGGHL